MNTKYMIIGLGTILLMGMGCTSPRSHFISDATCRNEVAKAFESKRAFFADGSLFRVFDREMTTREREALMFLYAWMPTGDVADYPGEFYLENVRASFTAQREMPWGKEIPEDVFRHFVLPVRVNNENLDSSRTVFYEELKDRVKGLSLREAVLEVNHWCHEKVVYTPSDGRTSSPLASVRTASGRCGEESTFTTAALRAVGIPARQVYTPRWAHTDDNHAWVEAWVEGEWCFLGACEPEPVLNLAWFNAPASRGMLMHTKVFGHYSGAEEVMEQTECYTEINVIRNYAPAARVTVTVVDTDSRPVTGALVEFKLYNYAEFYTVARKTTDHNGCSSLSAGKGDLLAWATKDGRFGYGQISFGKEDAVTVILNRRPGDEIVEAWDMTPPPEGNIPVEATEEQKKANALRLAEEDRIRNAYVATFCTEEMAASLAGELSLDAEKTGKILLKSRGNRAEIEAFLRGASAEQRPLALGLLEAISDKDLRDTPAATLFDHLLHTPAIPAGLCCHSLSAKTPSLSEAELFRRYVLNPRIANELLTPYKRFFAEQAPASLVDSARENPQTLADWVGRHIAVRDELNPQRIPVMPAGVWKARMADARSRQIFFVALARSMGIPARIERVAGKAQYYCNRWMDVDFEADSPGVTRQGFVSASYSPVPALDNPKYYTHFSIAKIRPDAQLQTLNFDRRGAAADMEQGDSWGGILKRPQPLDEGYYLIVSGMRLASGKVLTRMVSFAVKAGEHTSTELVMRENADDLRVIGSMDVEATFRPAGGGQETSILDIAGRGYFVVALLDARQEPTSHALRDIARFGKDFEQWNRSLIFLFGDEQALQQYHPEEFGALPSTITCGVDTDNRVADMLAGALKLPAAGRLPVFIIADSFGRIVFVSQGYTVGLGEQMLKIIHKL
ncbi:MAG: transglutaminase domain-containing protein [Tannerella sp.]|jgi:transglutaminase-like putative cysteine protease|nr:transglutaminase domain-containing protein [Tannerella sp.]